MFNQYKSFPEGGGNLPSPLKQRINILKKTLNVLEAFLDTYYTLIEIKKDLYEDTLINKQLIIQINIAMFLYEKTINKLHKKIENDFKELVEEKIIKEVTI